jgi:hypothetical protein
MLSLFRSIGRAIKRRLLRGCLTNPWLSIRWNTVASLRARVSVFAVATDIPVRVIKMRLEFVEQKG